MQQANESTLSDSARLTNAAKLVGEAVLPGASLMMDGKLAPGAAHAIVGFGARALAGPAGIVLIAANSYTKSVTGKYLWDHVAPLFKRSAKPVEAIEPAAEAVAESGIEPGAEPAPESVAGKGGKRA